MGNKILTQYDVQKEACYYSTDLKWRLHSASFKERPEEKLTIFLFEKKTVERYPKNTKEQILEVLKKDATSLQRLRHPQILSVLEALSEERSTLAFATKPVVGTVAQLLEHNRQELTNLEMKCGLLDVAEALQFLHQDAKTAHLSLGPHSIFIDPQGKWLLGGLGCSLSGVQWGQLVDCPFAFAGGDSAGQLSPEPPPRYAAPEMCGMPAKCGLESDIFSLGLLTYELMSNERQPLLRSAPRGFSNNILRAGTVPQDLFATLQKTLSQMPSDRPTIAAFINSDFFMDVNVRAVRFLEQLNEKDEAQRVTFLRGLPKLFQDPGSPLMGQRVIRERVLPRLCGALMFPGLYGVVVPIIINVLKKDKVSDCAHFQSRIWPSMKPLFSAKEIPIECVTLFLKELDLLVSFAAMDQTQAVLLPFLLRCLELQEPVILNEVLEKVPYLHKKFEYRQVKDQILPRMLQLLIQSSVVKVKVQVLMGLNKIFDIFDKNTIQDQILPAFEKLTKTDRTPAVCMCLLGCYDAMSKHLGPKITGDRIIPLMTPLLVEDGLSAEQFETQLSVCKKLLQRVESSRRKEYEVKKDAQADATSALGGQEAAAPTKAKAVEEKAEPEDFDSLLMGRKKPAPATAPAAVAAPAARVQAPPPPGAALAAPAAPSRDLLAVNFDTATPSAPSAMGGFDPFAGSAVSAAPAPKPANFDPFASMAPANAAPAGAMSGLNLGGPPGAGMFPGAGMPAGGMGYPGMAPGGMPGAPGMPGMQPGGMPGMPGAPAAQPPQMRNMNYDPFAEISNRG